MSKPHLTSKEMGFWVRGVLSFSFFVNLSKFSSMYSTLPRTSTTSASTASTRGLQSRRDSGGKGYQDHIATAYPIERRHSAERTYEPLTYSKYGVSDDRGAEK